MNFGKYIHGSQGDFPRLCIPLNAGLPGTTDHLLLTKNYFGKYADKTRTYVSFFWLLLFYFVLFYYLHRASYDLNIQPNIQGSLKTNSLRKHSKGHSCLPGLRHRFYNIPFI